MKIAFATHRANRAESAGISFRALLLLTGFALLPLMLAAVPPAWWQERGVLDSGQQANDFAAVNTGQLKHIAKQAMLELDAKIPGGAGTAIHQLIDAWPGQTAGRNDFSAVNTGQVKAVAKLFYDRLNAAGYTQPYPWNASAPDKDDFAGVNVGQLKAVFAFCVDCQPGDDTDGDGLGDAWEMTFFGSLAAANGDDDNDQDGIKNYVEFHYHSSPLSSDSDADGLTDNAEIMTFGTNPTATDTDGDGWGDGQENDHQSDPKAAASTPLTVNPDLLQQIVRVNVERLSISDVWWALFVVPVDPESGLGAYSAWRTRTAWRSNNEPAGFAEFPDLNQYSGGFGLPTAPHVGPPPVNTLVTGIATWPSVSVSNDVATDTSLYLDHFGDYVFAGTPILNGEDENSADYIQASMLQYSPYVVRLTATEPVPFSLSYGYVSVTRDRLAEPDSANPGETMPGIGEVAEITLKLEAGQQIGTPQVIDRLPDGDEQEWETQLFPAGNAPQVIPVRITSRDRFLAGSFRYSAGDNVSVQFVHGTSNETLGTYGQFSGGGTTRVYNSVDEILSEADAAAGSQGEAQKVWFVRSGQNIDFYTCFRTLGEVKLRFYREGQHVQTVIHTLNQADDFAAWIEYVDGWVRGVGFEFPETLPVLAGGSSNVTYFSVGANPSAEVHPWTRACLIPIYNVIAQVEGMEAVVKGALNGVKEGLNDDWEMVKLVRDGGLWVGGMNVEMVNRLLTEFQKWRSDPGHRGPQLKQMLDSFCQDWVFQPLADAGSTLTDWEKFKVASWEAWNRVKGIPKQVYAVGANMGGAISNGLKGWVDDFNTRMFEGGQTVAWQNAPWNLDPLVQDFFSEQRHRLYMFGYTCGYLIEQAASGVASAGTLMVSKIAVKGSASLIGRLTARATAACATHLHLVKRHLANALISVEMKVAIERGYAAAANKAFSPTLRNSVAEVVESGFGRSGYQQMLYNVSDFFDDIARSPRIQALLTTPTREAQTWEKLALYFNTLGPNATEAATKGWARLFDRLLKFENGAFVQDRADDFFALFKTQTPGGQNAARRTLEDYAEATITDPNAKVWIREIESIAPEGYRYGTYVPNEGWANYSGVIAPNPTGKPLFCTFDKFDSPAVVTDRLLLPLDSRQPTYRYEFSTSTVRDRARITGGNYDVDLVKEPLTRDVPPDFLGAGTGELGRATQFGVEGELQLTKVVNIETGAIVWPPN